jgi:hypothetical protein
MKSSQKTPIVQSVLSILIIFSTTIPWYKGQYYDSQTVNAWGVNFKFLGLALTPAWIVVLPAILTVFFAWLQYYSVWKGSQILPATMSLYGIIHSGDFINAEGTVGFGPYLSLSLYMISLLATFSSTLQKWLRYPIQIHIFAGFMFAFIVAGIFASGAYRYIHILKLISFLILPILFIYGSFMFLEFYIKGR